MVSKKERSESDNTLSKQDLRKFSILRALSDGELGELRKSIIFKTLKTDEVLFLRGESTKALYFVLSGWLKAEKTSREGRQQTLRFVGPGEIINELSVFSNSPNSVNVIAMEDALIFSISQEAVEQMLVQSPAFSRQVIENLSGRIEHLLNHIENLSLYPVEVRLARFLLEEAEDGLLERPPWKTQEEIAARLGTVMDVINRQLQKFAKSGYISVERNCIKIINQTDLQKIADG